MQSRRAAHKFNGISTFRDAAQVLSRFEPIRKKARARCEQSLCCLALQKFRKADSPHARAP